MGCWLIIISVGIVLVDVKTNKLMLFRYLHRSYNGFQHFKTFIILSVFSIGHFHYLEKVYHKSGDRLPLINNHFNKTTIFK